MRESTFTRRVSLLFLAFSSLACGSISVSMVRTPAPPALNMICSVCWTPSGFSITSWLVRILAPSRSVIFTFDPEYPFWWKEMVAGRRESGMARCGICTSVSSISCAIFSRPKPMVWIGMRWRRISETVSRSMPPELSEPSLSKTTAPIGRLDASATTCFKLSPMCVEGPSAFNSSGF